MEFHSMHKIFHSNHLGEEKHQMLNLNRRLESYLSRVKLLEEENALLAKEIQAMRHNSHGASAHRKGLEEKLRQTRLEVEEAWRDRVLTEMEIGKLAEELQALDLLRQREAQAHMEAKTKLAQSRKELEEEQRAQIWLREKVGQLEQEMRLLIQTHQQDVAHLEATLSRSRATMSHTAVQRCNQTPSLFQLGHEYTQRASRAWQEAAEAYQGQLARLEESLNQARSRLTQVDQEKRESQLKLQALEKEMASAQDVRLHLEKTAAQQRDTYSREIQQLQEHLDGLEAEKEEVGQQIDHLLVENRGLLQLKMSLGLEVATYRTLLDNESLKGDFSLLNQPRHISITDAIFSPQGVKKYYQTQLPASHKIASLASVRGTRGPTVITTTSTWSKKPVTVKETLKISEKPADSDATKSATWESPYPKILQDGAVENFRPQEVHEKVTYAEPLSPPNEQEDNAKTPEHKEKEENSNDVDIESLEEKPVVESVVSYQVESGLSSEPSFSDETGHHQFTTPSLTPYHVRMTEESCGFSDESDKEVAFEGTAEEEEMQQPHGPIEAWVKTECVGKEVEHVQEETSDSETEAMLEPTFGSRPSSPESECGPEESVFNQVTDYNFDENISNDYKTEMRQEVSCSAVGTNETDAEDKLYPDGEEMDTWDSVIERRIILKTDDGINNDEGKTQHAEPEEDISTKEPEHKKKEIKQDVFRDVDKDENVASSLTDKQVDDRQHIESEQEHDVRADGEEDDEEDSQNVSESWRTELEGDSYAQDNTLADTRPLIRYKSDETDANTQASHMEESESSEGEQERKAGETGTGMWNEDKAKRFGTMEDLCEDAEGVAMDEVYNMGYTHIEDRDGTIVSGHDGDGAENAEEMIRKVNEGHSDEETDEFTKPTVRVNADFDEELEIDRLVEQELENLSTDSYSAHFAQHQFSEEMGHLKGNTVEEMTEQEEPGKTKTEEMSNGVETGMKVNHELKSSITMTDQTSENLFISDSSVVTDTAAEEDIYHEDPQALDAPEKKEEDDETNVSMLTHADGTENFINRPDVEEHSSSEDPNSVLQVTADEKNLQDVAVLTEVKEEVPVEASYDSQKHLAEDVADCKEFPAAPEAAEWEVLENPGEDFDIRDQNEQGEKCDDVLEAANKGGTMHQVEPFEISPDSILNENDIFGLQDATNSSLHGLISSGVKNDFWVSSLESGASYQPEDTCNEAAEHTNQNLGFADGRVLGNSENQNVVNGNSRVDTDSANSPTAKNEKEQIHTEVKQVLCRKAGEGEFVHSEESEVEGESWSSGE
uniref:Nestin-like n=1 Tax=Acanthochromis polyacanthus TaxID=80966 RepID=A0A3Q1FB11_9TELE